MNFEVVDRKINYNKTIEKMNIGIIAKGKEQYDKRKCKQSGDSSE